MRYGGLKLKNPKKCDFYEFFNHLNGVKSKYKGLQIEKKYCCILHRIFENSFVFFCKMFLITVRQNSSSSRISLIRKEPPSNVKQKVMINYTIT